MPNELIPQLSNIALPDNSLKELTTSEEWLGRLQLYGHKSNAVAQEKIEANHYGIPEDDAVIDLGKELDVVILAWRPKALAATDDPIVESFDPLSDVFQDVKERSGVKDSGCMYGPEFLLWVPSVERFLTFFMSSKTARREARKMEPLIKCAATLKHRIIKQGIYVWPGPVVIACSTPLDIPDIEIIQKQVNKFLNPPKRDIELAETDDREV